MGIYELRTYHLQSTLMGLPMHDRMEHHALPLLREHGADVVGVWETLVGADLPAHVILFRWRDLAHREEVLGTAYKDERFWEILRDTEARAGSQIVRSYDISLLSPATYSPLQ